MLKQERIIYNEEDLEKIYCKGKKRENYPHRMRRMTDNGDKFLGILYCLLYMVDRMLQKSGIANRTQTKKKLQEKPVRNQRTKKG